MSYEIIEKLKKEIGDYQNKNEFVDVGLVIEAGDGIVKISGLPNALSQELLNIETSAGEVLALAFNLEENLIGAVALGDMSKVKVGNRVRKTDQVVSIKVGDEIVGRVVDPLGVPLDNKGEIFSGQKDSVDYSLEKKAPGVIMRESVKVPLHTGIKAVDAMIPIGRGQRELIIGDRQTGKTVIAIDAIINQKNDVIDEALLGKGEKNSSRSPVICIYVAIGQKNSKVAKTVNLLEKAGALDYTVVVSASASAPASLQYLAPFAGCAIGEYFMDQGKDVLVVYDDLSKHANAYRQISLLLRRPPGREAYPGDVFYLHSRLLERSAKLNKKLGGGSLTALPIIETQLGDVSAYIPTNVISITDGQIYLESNLFYQGVRPAVNVGLSVSRVGSAAQTKAMKKVAGKLRLELASFRELQAFVQFASDLDENTKKKIERGQLLTEVLKQMDQAPISFEKQVAILFAATDGLMDDLKIKNVLAFEKGLIEYLDRGHNEILKTIQISGVIDGEMEEKLRQAIISFKKIFLDDLKD